MATVPYNFIGPVQPGTTYAPLPKLTFYKYADNPTVFDNTGKAYSSWDEFLKAGGTQAAIQIRPRTAIPAVPGVRQVSSVGQYLQPAVTPTPKAVLPPVAPVAPRQAGTLTPEQKAQLQRAASGADKDLFIKQMGGGALNTTANFFSGLIPATGQVAKTALQAFPRAVESVILSAQNDPEPVVAKNAFARAIYGSEPINPIAREVADRELQFKDAGLGKASLPLASALVIGSTTLDLWPGLGSGEAKLAKEAGALLTEQLAKGVAKEEALNLIYKRFGTKIGQAVEKGVLPKIEQAITKEVVSQIDNGKPVLPPKLELPPVTKKDSIITKLRNALSPIKATDAEAQATYRSWSNAKLTAKELANAEAKQLTNIPAKQGLETILKYEKGEATPYSGQIQQVFDKLHKEAVERGLDVPYQQNYITQMYKNSPDEVKLATAHYLKDQGVEPGVITDYLTGKDLPEVISAKLKLNPSFSGPRVFPDYETAMKYGLTPKYTHPAQIAAEYRKSMETAIANRKLINDLIGQGKLVSASSAPSGFKPVDLAFSGKGYYAEPKLAAALNGLFRDEMNLNFVQAAHGLGAKASKFMQELALSAGFPATDVNFFSIGQLIKQLTSRAGQLVTHPLQATSGAFKDISAFARANLDSQTIKFFEKKSDMLQKMADNGIDMSGRVGTYRDMYKNMVGKTEWGKALGRGWDRLFQKKTFASLMPMFQVNTFEEAYKGALKRGLSDEVASKVAADVTRAFHGLTEDVARSKGTQDALSTYFFAPKFREGIINTLWNTGRSVADPRTWRDPSFAKNRQLATGMAITFAMYQALNQKLNGQFTWENETGREFSLRVPLPDNQVMYIEFMPSFLSLPRNIVGAGIAAGKLDPKTFSQKLSSVFSMPIQTASELYSNRDYFGRDIVGANDSTEEKLTKWAKYLGLQKTHPYLRLVADLTAPDKDFKKPITQSLAEAAEFPVKFNSLDRISRQEFYEAIERKNKENAAIKDRIQPIYDRVQALKDAGNEAEAQAIVDGLSEEDYTVYKSIRASGTRSDTVNLESKLYKTYQEIQNLKASGQESRAQQIVDDMTDDEYHAYTLLKNRFNPTP